MFNDRPKRSPGKSTPNKQKIYKPKHKMSYKINNLIPISTRKWSTVIWSSTFEVNYFIICVEELENLNNFVLQKK
ncbi:hypothetical protein Mgra_00006691, partial [Meloidogyne graminicola]